VALVIGLGLTAIAASGARAKVRPIEIDGFRQSSSVSPVDDVVDAEKASILSPMSGWSDDAKDEPTPEALTMEWSSPLAAVSAPDVSPYDFFKGVIAIPLSVAAQTGMSTATYHLFAPSLFGRTTLTDVLSNSNAFIGRGARRSRSAM